MRTKRRVEPVVDFKGRPITLGTVVRFDAYEATKDWPGQPEAWGVVTAISDYDVSDGDYGQPVGINPVVTVTYLDGTTEEWSTMSPMSYGNEDFVADELEAAVHGPWLPEPTNHEEDH